MAPYITTTSGLMLPAGSIPYPIPPEGYFMPYGFDPGPENPLWWLNRLELALDHKRNDIQLFDDYYFGQHRLSYATTKYREAFGNLFQGWADNWCDVVVEASSERLELVGFRFPSAEEQDDDTETTAEEDAEEAADNEDDDPDSADRAAWAIWQANNLDAYSQMAHIEAIKSRESYVIVQPGDATTGGLPKITCEAPSQVIVETLPGDRRVRLAGLKKWVDERGHVQATVYLPDGIYRFQSSAMIGGIEAGTVRGGWEPRPGQDYYTANPLGVVPVIPMMNNPTLRRGGRSDIERVIPLQDAVNKILNDGLIASEFGAFQQRVLLGVEMARDEQGNPIPLDEIRSAMSRLWVFEDKNATATTFPAVDLENFYSFAAHLLQHMASQTRVPSHYFLGTTSRFPSGDALKGAEAGLIAKVRGKMVHFGEAWEEAMRLAFRLNGDEARGNSRIEAIWADPEFRTPSERADSLVKRRAIGIPLEALWVEAGYTPAQIARFKEMREEEAELEALYSPKSAQNADGSSSGSGDLALSSPANAALKAEGAGPEGGGGDQD